MAAPPISPNPTDPSDACPAESPTEPDAALVGALAEASRRFDATGADAERNCWLAVHQHVHGVLPSEYDIRDIDEDLYLAVLAYRLSAKEGSDIDLSGVVPLSSATGEA
jgi:hypothetical protein